MFSIARNQMHKPILKVLPHISKYGKKPNKLISNTLSETGSNKAWTNFNGLILNQLTQSRFYTNTSFKNSSIGVSDGDKKSVVKDRYAEISESITEMLKKFDEDHSRGKDVSQFANKWDNISEKYILKQVSAPGEEKLYELFSQFEKIILGKQHAGGYSFKVDAFFKNSSTITLKNKKSGSLTAGMDLVKSNGTGTPIFRLPSKIMFGNGTEKQYDEGLKYSDDYNAVFSKYNKDNTYLVEGRLFMCLEKESVIPLMAKGLDTLVTMDCSGCFALANVGSPMAKVLEAFGFKKAEDGDKNAIKKISFLGGHTNEEVPKPIKIKDTDIAIPKYTVDGNPVWFEVFFLERSTAINLIQDKENIGKIQLDISSLPNEIYATSF